MTENEYRERTHFVTKLGLSLHRCGASSSRIERHLKNLCELLEIHGAFLYSPTSFTFCYWLDDPSEQIVKVERISPSDGDLGRLEQIDALITRFEEKELEFSDMWQAFEEAGGSVNYYKKWLQCLAWMVSSVCFASIFSTNLIDGLASGVISILVFVLAEYSSRSSRFTATTEVTAAVLSGVLATAVAALGLGINVPLVVLSTLIVFIPGVSLTVALSEIAERDLVSGTSKLVDAVMSLFKLYIGALLGMGLGEALWPVMAVPTVLNLPTLPSWKVIPLMLLLSVAVSLVLNIRLRLIPWCIVSALIGFTVAQYAGAAFGTVVGMFLGALAVGMYANWFANYRNKPATIVLLQGIIVLVPGSKSYMVLNAWITGEQILSDGPSINEAFLTFISLVVGLLLANALLPSRKSL